MLGQGKPQESIGGLPAPSRPASCSRGGGVLERTTHCCLAPTQGAFGEEHCFEGGKAWLTSHFEEATGLECFHQMMHLGWAIPIPRGGPIRPGLVGKRFTWRLLLSGNRILSMLASGGGLSYGSPAAASDRPSRLILIWLYLYVASHVSST